MLFNTLANLRVLIALDPPRAQAMLDRLIAFLRATLEASRAGTHTLADEFARIDDYLALMAVRMGPRLQCSSTCRPSWQRCRCRRCCCSRWWKTASATAWSRRSRAGASSSAPGATAHACCWSVHDNGVGLPDSRATPRGFRPGAGARTPGHPLRRCAPGWNCARPSPAAPSPRVVPAAGRHEHHARADRRRRTAAGRRAARRPGSACGRPAGRGHGGRRRQRGGAGAGAAARGVLPRHPHARPERAGSGAGTGRGLARGRSPFRCWCSSPPTTSTRCRPSSGRRWTTCSSRWTTRGWRSACSGCRRCWPAVPPHRRWPRRWSNCAHCLARRGWRGRRHPGWP